VAIIDDSHGEVNREDVRGTANGFAEGPDACR